MRRREGILEKIKARKPLLFVREWTVKWKWRKKHRNEHQQNFYQEEESEELKNLASSDERKKRRKKRDINSTYQQRLLQERTQIVYFCYLFKFFLPPAVDWHLFIETPLSNNTKQQNTSSNKPLAKVARKETHQLTRRWFFICEGRNESKAANLELMELENIVANTVYLKAREGEKSMITKNGCTLNECGDY